MYKLRDSRTKPLFSDFSSLDAFASGAEEIMVANSLAHAIGGLKIHIPLGAIREFGLEGAAFLQQAAMLSSMSHEEAGWFSLRAVGDAEPSEQDVLLQLGSWKAALGIRREAQQKIRRRLLEAGLIEERRCGVPARLFYRVNHQAYLEFLASSGHAIQVSSFRKPAHVENAVCREALQDHTNSTESSNDITQKAEEARQVAWGFRTVSRALRRVARSILRRPA